MARPSQVGLICPQLLCQGPGLTVQKGTQRIVTQSIGFGR